MLTPKTETRTYLTNLDIIDTKNPNLSLVKYHSKGITYQGLFETISLGEGRLEVEVLTMPERGSLALVKTNGHGSFGDRTQILVYKNHLSSEAVCLSPLQ
jgi:hypothetical protein